MIWRTKYKLNQWDSISYRAERGKYHQSKVDKLNKISVLPEFNDLLRKLYKKVHPDIISLQYPALAQNNNQSMQELNEILSTIKVNNEYPPKLLKTLTFHMKSDNGDIQAVNLVINTAGGDCRKQLTKAFTDFFIMTKLSGNGIFNWNKDYFPDVKNI